MEKYKRTSFSTATIFSIAVFTSVLVVLLVVINLFHISPLFLAISIEGAALLVMLCIFFCLHLKREKVDNARVKESKVANIKKTK